MKTVFNNQMVAHVWAQMKQPHGRNSSNSKHFDGAVAYSYREPVAHIVKVPGGYQTLLYVPNQWGVTTARHIMGYRRAFSGGPEFEVPDIFPHIAHSSHATNIAYLRKQYDQCKDQLARMPSQSYRIRGNAAHETLRDLANKLRTYADLFSLPDVAMCPWSSDADAIIARRDRLLNDPKLAAKREARENAARLKKERDAKLAFERNAEDIAKWYNGVPVHARLSDENGGALLRVSNGGYKAVTSWGASVPLAEAKAILPRLLAARANIHGTVSYLVCDWDIGQFKVDEVNTRGIEAGCHKISWAELERFAAVLGIPS